MAINKLFIFDPKSNTAVSIAKGYSSGWFSGIKYIDDWFDNMDNEYTGEIDKTRFELKTENDLPDDTKITYQDFKLLKESNLRLVKWIIKNIVKNRKL